MMNTITLGSDKPPFVLKGITKYELNCGAIKPGEGWNSAATRLLKEAKCKIGFIDAEGVYVATEWSEGLEYSIIPSSMKIGENINTLGVGDAE